jgi:hypothetical protein
MGEKHKDIFVGSAKRPTFRKAKTANYMNLG